MVNKYHSELKNLTGFKKISKDQSKFKVGLEEAKALLKGLRPKKKTMQKIPHDLTYMKGYLKGK